MVWTPLDWMVKRCLLCTLPADSNAGLCRECRARLTPIGAHCRSCARYVADTEFVCGSCLVKPPPFSNIYIAFRYHGALRDVVLQAKYGKSRAAIKLLMQWTTELSEALPQDIDLVVAMPIALPRLLQRGFNQTHYLAKAASAVLGVPCLKSALRKSMRPPQSQQNNDAARRQNICGAFRSGSQPVFGHVLLVDDVFTSGATGSEAARVLKAAGATKVSFLVLAARQ